MSYQDILAKCYVAMSEVDYEIDEWRFNLITVEIICEWEGLEWKKVGKA